MPRRKRLPLPDRARRVVAVLLLAALVCDAAFLLPNGRDRRYSTAGILVQSRYGESWTPPRLFFDAFRDESGGWRVRFMAEDPNDTPTLRVQVGRWTTSSGFWAVTRRKVEYMLWTDGGVAPPQPQIIINEIQGLLEALPASPETPLVNDLIVALPAGLPARTEPLLLGYVHNSVASIAALTLGWTLAVELQALARWRSSAIRQRRGRCPRCGYDLRHDLAAGCPECGWNRGGAKL